MEPVFISRLTEITQAHLTDPAFGVAELANEIGISHSSLFRKVRTVTGKSVSEFIRDIRLAKALEILQEEEVTIATAAYRSGFSSPSYFNRCFHHFFGYPPGELRKQAVKIHEEVPAEAKNPILLPARNKPEPAVARPKRAMVFSHYLSAWLPHLMLKLRL
jgi:AraC-like DNA-binding protein